MDVTYQIIFLLLFIGLILYVRYKYFDKSRPIKPWLRGNPLALLVVAIALVVYYVLRAVHLL